MKTLVFYTIIMWGLARVGDSSRERRIYYIENKFLYILTFPYHLGKDIRMSGYYFILSMELHWIGVMISYVLSVRSGNTFVSDSWFILIFLGSGLITGILAVLSNWLMDRQNRVMAIACLTVFGVMYILVGVLFGFLMGRELIPFIFYCLQTCLLIHGIFSIVKEYKVRKNG